ncbi:unnamed protein product [Meganyctiphanes norvegica]|uniref:Ig-like domain-containing protein n=1 Tax=Meganyctiphanes norvegica TaxID=48144 RepID=A0AAV2PY79_MEGNR
MFMIMLSLNKVALLCVTILLTGSVPVSALSHRYGDIGLPPHNVYSSDINSLQAAQVRHPSHNVQLPFQRLQPGYTSQGSRSSDSGGRHLSGSSSSPVEPIKPLLDLTRYQSPGGGLTMPPHPVFDKAAPRNVSSLSDNAAYLHCLVHNLGNKSVSWIRQRDLHILTVGRYTYTTDQRYEVIHSDNSQDWILKIKYAQERDSGNYECQVSTKPIRSYSVNLNVFAAPKADIIGAPDLHVDKGSTINLTCIIAHSPELPNYIFWYHNGKVVNYDSPRGGITVGTERNNTTRGYLLIQNASTGDNGNYSCAPSNTASTTVHVHVLNDDIPAAMQTSGGGPRTSLLSSVLPPVLVILLQPPTMLLLSLSVVPHLLSATRSYKLQENN